MMNTTLPRPTFRAFRFGLATAAVLLTASLISGQVGQGVAPSQSDTYGNYPPVTGRPAMQMPTAPQFEAIAAFNAAVQSRAQEVAAARADLLAASLTVPSTAAVLGQKAAALAAAEMALATARADALATLQKSPNRLTAAQVSLLAETPPGPALAIGNLPPDPNEAIQTLPGFKVEMVAMAHRPIQGSWISIAQDDQGRILLGANEQQPFTRLTLNATGQVTKNETIYTPISEMMGSLWHDGALYVGAGRGRALVYGKSNPTFCCESGDMGLHRLKDPAGDGSFSSIETLLLLQGDEAGHSDHGVHDPVLSPDGRYLYMINGNRTYYPAVMSPLSPVRHNLDDRVIPILSGGGGRGGAAEAAPNAPITGGGQGFGAAARAAGRFGYGGWLGRMDLNGQDFHLFATGFRNALHFDFNGDGEIFTYDSDHEPERGVPWYTPTRVLWAPSAANFGHRGGSESGKYPEWYEDATPPLFNIGLGSPVGVTFGYNTKFPAEYQKALYIADNAYGRIMAIHLKPLGSGYTVGSMEYFAYPKALFFPSTSRPGHTVTDMMVARDGSFYYVIGTRSAQAYLMRVTYTGPRSTAKVDYTNVDGAADRKIRRTLEEFHWKQGTAQTVTAAWPYLGSDDRAIRYAARVALETVAPSVWKQRALTETDASTALGALLALARVGGKESSEELFAALNKLPLSSLSDPMKIRKLRIYEVALSRNGKPSDATSQKIIADVDANFPAKTFALNTESSQILAYFNAPTAVPKTMAVISRTKIYQENFAYRYNIRSVTTGWTPELRKVYFQWFTEDHANDTFIGEYREWAERVNQRPSLAGNVGPMGQVRTAAIATLTDAEKADAALSAIVAQPIPGSAGGFRGGGPGVQAPAAAGSDKR
jgi:hypothetical protein